MTKLTTQLQQARQEIAEKEAESRAWEERVAGLSLQLKEESSKIEVSLGVPGGEAGTSAAEPGAVSLAVVCGALGPVFLLTSCYNHCRRSQSCGGKL